MRGAEWSLIISTLLTQLAIGTFVVIVTVNTLYISKSDSLVGKDIVSKILLAIVVVLILAILTSFLHIGKPKNAPLAISHFSKSWLSREIVFLMLFTFLAGISFVMQHISGGSHLVREALTVITGIIGIITIISMAKVYMLDTVPAWNSSATPIQFISTSIILGGVTVIFIFVLFGDSFDSGGLTSDVNRMLFPVLLFLIFIHLITFLIHLYTLPNAGIAGAESFKLLTENHVVLLILKLSLILLSVILVCALLFADTKSFTTYFLIILCSIVFISEIVGRYLFYASYSRVGM